MPPLRRVTCSNPAALSFLVALLAVWPRLHTTMIGRYLIIADIQQDEPQILHFLAELRVLIDLAEDLRQLPS